MSKSTEEVCPYLGETRQEATVRILTGSAPGQKLPMRRYEGKKLQIACVRKSGSGGFVLNVGENIWGGDGLGELAYGQLEKLIQAGWEID